MNARIDSELIGIVMTTVVPMRYWANDLGIDITRGGWRRGFCEIKDMNTINAIDNARRKNGF
jgi:hypothetical protein